MSRALKEASTIMLEYYAGIGSNKAIIHTKNHCSNTHLYCIQVCFRSEIDIYLSLVLDRSNVFSVLLTHIPALNQCNTLAFDSDMCRCAKVHCFREEEHNSTEERIVK